MDVDESRSKFFEAKTRIEDCRRAIAGLQKKYDTFEASLPELTQQIENAEKIKQVALDNFALHGNKESESELKRARAGCESAIKQQSETNELIESVARTLKRQEGELVKLNNAVDLARRACWESITSELRSRISEGVVSDIQRLIVVGTQMGKTKQFILSELLPNLNPSECQAIRDEMIKKYGLIE